MNKLILGILGLPGTTFFVAVIAAQEEGLPHPQTLIIPLIIILFLILLNGIFVAAEFAITGVRPTQIEELAHAGNATAKEVLNVLESQPQQDRYIATAQLGITITSLGLGMYGEPQIAHFIEPYLARVLNIDPSVALIHSAGYIITLSLLTYMHIVLGEMVPKSISLGQPRQTALALSEPMRLMGIVMRIPVKVLNNTGNLLMRLLRIPPGEDPVHSPQELEQIIAESAEKGKLTEDEEDLILNIFNFADRDVHQVMTPTRRIQAVSADIELDELIELASNSTFSRFPVYEEDLDHVIGILHLKDLIRQQLLNQENFDLRLLLRPAPTIPEHYPAEKLLKAFKLRRMHMAIVLDEYGGTAGIVTLEDLVEEIVGEVRDEFDKKEKDPLIELAPGSLELSGQFLLDDLQDYVDLGNEETLPDVETVGGLIITEIGRPPQKGDQLMYKEYISFTVLAIDGLAVARARIDFPIDASDDDDSAQEETTP